VALRTALPSHSEPPADPESPRVPPSDRFGAKSIDDAAGECGKSELLRPRASLRLFGQPCSGRPRPKRVEESPGDSALRARHPPEVPSTHAVKKVSRRKNRLLASCRGAEAPFFSRKTWPCMRSQRACRCSSEHSRRRPSQLHQIRVLPPQNCVDLFWSTRSCWDGPRE
jgi:hypothetical protein